jgi:hypothetical protein
VAELLLCLHGEEKERTAASSPKPIVYFYWHHDKQGIPAQDAEKDRATLWRARLLDSGRKATTARDRARDALRRKELADPALSSGLPEGQAAEGVEGTPRKSGSLERIQQERQTQRARESDREFQDGYAMGVLSLS